MTSLQDLEDKIAASQALTRDDAKRLAASPDLVGVGLLGERVRKDLHGDRVTFVRVCDVGPGQAPTERGEAGEIRLTGVPESIDEARLRVREAARLAPGVPLTGFSLADLLHLAGGDSTVLAELVVMLRYEGLEAVAEVPVDRFASVEVAAAAVRAVVGGGLSAWRATVADAAFADRLELMERAAAVQRETGAFRAFAPLPRQDPHDQPSTGYDDVRTVAFARVMCRNIPSIQVDWPLYGPKLAQVAIAYGADDIDGIAGVAATDLGHRRSPREEIERHIRMAFAQPVERNGRYELRR